MDKTVFFHGIQYRHLEEQFPYIYPDAHISTKNLTQLKDRQHLMERFGFEPVHLLESSRSYPVKTCLQECFAYGNVVLAYSSIPQPYWQISPHEMGVACLDVHQARYIFVPSLGIRDRLKGWLPKRNHSIIVTHI